MHNSVATFDKEGKVQAILLVEDNEHDRLLTKTILEEAGHLVYEARDGDEAINLLGQCRPDLLMTDLVMPKKEGLELIREVHRDYPDIRIIAMTGASVAVSETYLNMARALGAHSVFTKSANPDDLLQVVDQTLNR
jgi:CheY-like chemotaxis protein